MRFEAYPSEIAALPSLSDGERLDYFLLRAFETEEAWMLKQGALWFSRPLENEVNGFAAGQRILPVWCYRHYAMDAALEIWTDCRPASVSLEYFIEEEIPRLIEQDIVLDVMPRDSEPGCLITPHRLSSIFEGIMNAGEYRLEG